MTFPPAPLETVNWNQLGLSITDAGRVSAVYPPLLKYLQTFSKRPCRIQIQCRRRNLERAQIHSLSLFIDPRPRPSPQLWPTSLRRTESSSRPKRQHQPVPPCRPRRPHERFSVLRVHSRNPSRALHEMCQDGRRSKWRMGCAPLF
jgi:hypothetical protein